MMQASIPRAAFAALLGVLLVQGCASSPPSPDKAETLALLERRAAANAALAAERNAGVMLPMGLLPLQIERIRLTADADRLRESLALRAQLLAGEISGAEAEFGNRLVLATARQRVADVALESGREVNSLLQARYEAGTASIGELAASNRELLEIELESEMAEFEVETLARELALAAIE